MNTSTHTLKTPPIRIHSFTPYDRGGKVRWLLTEMGVAFEDRWLDREIKENDQPEYLRLNPMGRVPTVEVGDTVIFESSAICAYFADRFLDRGMAPALDSPARAEYQQWMYFAAATLDVVQTRIMIIEDIPPGEVFTAKETALMSDFRDSLQALELKLTKNDFLVANRFSAADINVSYPLYFARLWPELQTVIQEFPRVAGYLERMMKMPSAIKANVFSFPE